VEGDNPVLFRVILKCAIECNSTISVSDIGEFVHQVAYYAGKLGATECASELTALLEKQVSYRLCVESVFNSADPAWPARVPLPMSMENMPPFRHATELHEQLAALVEAPNISWCLENLLLDVSLQHPHTQATALHYLLDPGLYVQKSLVRPFIRPAAVVEELVTSLLARGAQVNVGDWCGVTPLHLAVKNGYRGVVELLLSAGAQVDAKTTYGSTPIDFATAAGHMELIPLLHATD
jgi:hypothetical protein